MSTQNQLWRYCMLLDCTSWEAQGSCLSPCTSHPTLAGTGSQWLQPQHNYIDPIELLRALGVYLIGSDGQIAFLIN